MGSRRNLCTFNTKQFELSRAPEFSRSLKTVFLSEDRTTWGPVQALTSSG